MNQLNILVDENIPEAETFFGSLGRVVKAPGRTISPAMLANTDVLIVRSITKVNESLLAESPVRFVGTCTIGVDHIDQVYLKQRGIGFAAAPGCNANAVVDYVLSALAVLSTETQESFLDKTVGIVGMGQVGSRLRGRLNALGVNCLVSDPPLVDSGVAGLVPLDEVLTADIVSVHTPLTGSGEHATHHLLNADNLRRLKPGAWLINTARGAVVDNQALSDLLDARPDLKVVLDVWENEPDIDVGLMATAAVSTPHIAGYSLEGKLRGTAMIYEVLCQYIGESPEVTFEQVVPAAVTRNLGSVDSVGWQSCCEAVLACYDVRSDSERLITAFANENLPAGQAFDRLRKEYPVRREYAMTQLLMPEGGAEKEEGFAAKISALGIGRAC